MDYEKLFEYIRSENHVVIYRNWTDVARDILGNDPYFIEFHGSSRTLQLNDNELQFFYIFEIKQVAMIRRNNG